jgi:hypothetical protein
MRYGILAMILLFAVISSGCTQTTTSPVMVTTPTPAPAITTLVTLPPATPVIPVAQMNINVTAWQTKSDVIVQYNGGSNAADLTGFKIQIDNHNGQNVKQTINAPAIGSIYTFPYIGTPDADTVNVVGVFKGGSEQTVLFAYV